MTQAESVSGSEQLPPRRIEFAGRRWEVRQGEARGNCFAAANVVVDVHGRLFLGIARHAGRWTAAEVTLAEPVSYGEYAIVVDSPLNLPENVVLGFALRHSEDYQLAIQLSPWWGRQANAQFLAQDLGHLPGGFLDTFCLPTELAPTRHVIRWGPGSVEFASYDARPRRLPLRGPRLLHQARLEVTLPRYAYQLTLGFWLFRGDPPGDNRDQRLWVRDVLMTAR